MMAVNLSRVAGPPEFEHQILRFFRQINILKSYNSVVFCHVRLAEIQICQSDQSLLYLHVETLTLFTVEPQ